MHLDVPRPTMVARVVNRGAESNREDDRVDVADRRATVFAGELETLLAYYTPLGLVHRIDGTRSIPDVQREIFESLS